MVQKPYIVCKGVIVWPPTPNQCTIQKNPSNLSIDLIASSFIPPKKKWFPFSDPPVETIWKKEKESKHLFPKLPKNHSLFSSRFLGLPWHAHSQEKLLRSNIPRLKKKAKEWLQVVLREFWSLGVICIFSSETLSWCFTSFLGHTAWMHEFRWSKW